MPYLICYDITNDSLRTRMGKKIIAAGLDRINKSVYLGVIKETALEKLESQLATLLKDKGTPTDSLILLQVNPSQIQAMRIYGENGLDQSELSGDKSTLIL